MPTHAERADRAGTEDGAAPAGPRTAVIPRDAAARGRPQRHKTFATNVEMKEMIDRATPLFPIEAITDPPSTPSEPAAGTSEPDAPRSAAGEAEPAPNVTAKLARPPSRSLLVLVGFGGLALAAGAVYMFFENRERVLRGRPDAAVMYLDAAPEPDAASDAPIATDAPIDAGVADAREPHDAAADPRDARVRVDATRPAPDAGVRAMATLKVGAIPWGEIYIDGKPVGRTPRELSVTAGHHTVEVVFPAETPPRRQTFAVDLASGETKAVQAEF